MDQGSMSTVIEHGVVDPKPTVKAVAFCEEPLLGVDLARCVCAGWRA